ncbi:MAG TPA: aminodeoxychorismate lyase [Steroidobacteraceae bacterium]|nr:aminodeoxychorismate lyase [Steroidobacteraceae bacterium]
MNAGETAALVNGLPQAVVSVHDRGLQYGDGLFETFRCEQGRVRWFERHLARLGAGCARLGIPRPDGEVLRREAESLVAGQARALVKLLLTRGVARARGYRPAGDEQATRILSVHPWPAAGRPEFRLGLSPVPLACNPLLAGLKHLNRLEQVLAQQGAAASGVDEVLMCARSGQVISGSMSNLFVVQDETLLTPPLEEGGVAGVMRSLVLDLAPQRGIAVRVQPLSPKAVALAPALFVTNVRLGVQAVHWYEGRRLQPDARGLALQELIDRAEP